MSVLTNGSFTSPNLITSNLNIVSVNDVITNGIFSQPVVSDGVYTYWNDLTQSDKDLFYWTPNTDYSNSVSIQRGITAFNYPKPIGISTQYCDIQQDDYIQQSVFLNKRGYYQFSYYYISRGYPYLTNPLNFVLNYTITLDSIPSTDVSSWTNRKSIYYNYDTSANLNVPLLVQGQGFGIEKHTALANISLTEVYGSASNSEFNTASYYWDISGTVYLVSNKNPSYDFPDLYDLGTRQFSIISNQSSISQSITLTGFGYYTIQFYYASRTGYDFNNLEIYYADILIDTIKSCTTGVWNLYQKNVLISYSNGVPKFELRGITSNSQIGLAEIQFIGPPSLINAPPVAGYIQSAVIGATPDLSMNLMNKTSIYGSFSVQNKYESYNADGTPSGRLLEEGEARIYGNLTAYGYAKFMNTIDITGSNISGKNITGTGVLSVGTNATNSFNVGNTTYPTGNTLSMASNNGLEIFWNKIEAGNGMTDLLNKSQSAGGTDRGGFTFNTVNSTYTSKTLFYSGDKKFYVNTNVGILTTAPAHPLDVNGNANVSGTLSITKDIKIIADGLQSIYFNNGSSIIGRLYGSLTGSSMFFDFYNKLTFRYCNNTTNTPTNATLLQLQSTGISVNGSITSTGSLTGTSFNLTTPSNLFYKTNITTATAITSNSSYTIQISSVPAGLYIITYAIKLINAGGALSTTVSKFICRIDTINTSTSAVVDTILYHQDYKTAVLPAGSNLTTYSNTITYINPATQHFRLTFTPTHNNALSYGFNTNLASSFIQAQKIG